MYKAYDSSTGLFINSWRSGRGYSFSNVGKVFSRIGYVSRAFASLDPEVRARMVIVEFRLQVVRSMHEDGTRI